jgi:hypothetical protein
MGVFLYNNPIVNQYRNKVMNTITYPKAEKFANTMILPVIACPITKELYGTIKLVLDIPKARNILFCAGIRDEEAVEFAYNILRERISYM